MKSLAENSHAWAFGWEALAAIGTLALALATTALAWTTRRLAQESAADLRSQWRPLLVPGERTGALRYSREALKLQVPIRNSGRGPALFVRTLLDPDGSSPANWSLGSVAPGDEVTLVFEGVYPVDPPRRQVLADYRDLSERTYSTSIVIEGFPDEPRFYDVRPYVSHPVTPHGDALPQEGLQHVAPAPRRPMRQRLKDAWQAFRAP
jgi:hypothetical protein